MGKKLSQASLTVKQVLLTFLVTLVVGGGVTIAQSWYSLGQERNAADTRIRLLIESARENAAASAYRLDSDLADYVTTGLSSAPEIHSATILDENGSLLASQVDSAQAAAPAWLLDFAYRNLSDIEIPLFGQGRADLQVGLLRVEPDRNALANAFLDALRSRVLVDGAQAVLLALALSVLFFFALTRPLLNLAQAVKQVRPGQDDALGQVDSLRAQGDELGNLVASFDEQLLLFNKLLRERSLLLKDLRLRDAALDAMDSGMLIIDSGKPSMPIVDENMAVAEMLGFAPGAMLDRPLSELIDSLGAARGEHGPIREFITSAMTGSGASAIYEIDSDNGQTRLYTISIVPVQENRLDAAYRVMIISDITRARETEDKLRHSQKMDALGKVAGGIAHDFNNMLGVMRGNLDMANIDFANNPAVMKFLGPIDRSVDRAAELTGRLLRFSRKAPVHASSVKVDEVITHMRDLLASSLTPQIEIRLEPGAAEAKVRIDRGDFEDALLNLAVNARDAMPEGGTLSLSTWTETLGPDSEALRDNMQPGSYLCLRVADTGTGIDPAIQKHLFEPFFTTKEVSRGTGLGLSQVYGFVERSDGNILVHSSPGSGSQFTIYLPLKDDSRLSRETTNNKWGYVGGSETILLVDDESDLLSVAEQMLSRLGYAVIATTSPAEAIALFRERAQEIDMLLSDVVMPGGINGYELAKQLQEIKPGLRILMTSGYDSKRVDSETIFPLLGKPYSTDAMASYVRWILDRPRNDQRNKPPEFDTQNEQANH
jgi:signal transduction histidine kinase/CheY-like chemotaxis protein